MITASSNTATIKQGDAYRMPIHIYFNGAEITENVLPLLDEVEFTLADQDPVRCKATEAFSEALGAFLFPLTQEQTFELNVGKTTLDVRVQFLGGDVLGIKEKMKINVVDATSEEVL